MASRKPLFHTIPAILLAALFSLLTACNNETDKALDNAEKWLDQLELDLAYIREKGYGDVKRLSEAVGAYWKLYRYATPERQAQIRQRVEPFWAYTQNESYLDLISVDAKTFKQNSMSYLRIMWLFREMGLDISHLQAGFDQFRERMDKHLDTRGPWQKSMFARYYDFFGYEKPAAIANTNRLTGPIKRRIRANKYDDTKAYQLTHQIFVAFDYGAKREQTRFTDGELKYLDQVLPELSDVYLGKKNWDLLAELLTCMVYLQQTGKPEFKTAMTALLAAQNPNGSWGEYERLRKKYGNDVNLKYYLHTTGVVIEALVEHARGDWG